MEKDFDNNNENCIEFLSGEHYAVATFTNRKHINRIKNIYTDTGFQRIESNGDVTIPANGSVRLLASEIITQVQNGNLLFTGIDGQGTHATLYIEDKPTRIEADFETETTNQVVICEEIVKNLFAKNKKDFESELIELVKTRAEEFAIIGIIRNLKINDYEKVRAVENLTGLRV